MTDRKSETMGNRIGGTAGLALCMLISASSVSTSVQTIQISKIPIETIGTKPSELHKLSSGMSYILSGYNVDHTSYSGKNRVLINEEKIYNLKKLDQIEALEDNWNGNGAKAFNKQLLEKTRKIITLLEKQPEVFPTGCDSIQIEYEKKDGSYLEIELSLAKQWNVFEVDSTGKEYTFFITANIEPLIKVVDEFYG